MMVKTMFCVVGDSYWFPVEQLDEVKVAIAEGVKLVIKDSISTANAILENSTILEDLGPIKCVNLTDIECIEVFNKINCPVTLLNSKIVGLDKDDIVTKIKEAIKFHEDNLNANVSDLLDLASVKFNITTSNLDNKELQASVVYGAKMNSYCRYMNNGKVFLTESSEEELISKLDKLIVDMGTLVGNVAICNKNRDVTADYDLVVSQAEIISQELTNFIKTVIKIDRLENIDGRAILDVGDVMNILLSTANIKIFPIVKVI